MLKELKELVALVVAVVKAGQAAAADGKLDLNDLGFLMAVVPALGPALDNMGGIAAELDNWDEAHEAEMIAYIDQQFGDGTWELISEDALLAASHMLSLAKKLGA